MGACASSTADITTTGTSAMPDEVHEVHVEIFPVLAEVIVEVPVVAVVASVITIEIQEDVEPVEPTEPAIEIQEDAEPPCDELSVFHFDPVLINLAARIIELNGKRQSALRRSHQYDAANNIFLVAGALDDWHGANERVGVLQARLGAYTAGWSEDSKARLVMKARHYRPRWSQSFREEQHERWT